MLNGEGATSIFTIDENTGDIHATKRLDREEQAYYTLRAQARNRATNLPVEPESEFVIKVQDINDNEPKFLDGPYNAQVPEMSPVGKCLGFCYTHIVTSNISCVMMVISYYMSVVLKPAKLPCTDSCFLKTIREHHK